MDYSQKIRGCLNVLWDLPDSTNEFGRYDSLCALTRRPAIVFGVKINLAGQDLLLIDPK